MQVKKSSPAVFSPFVIEVVVESKEDLDMLECMSMLDSTIPAMVSEFTGQSDHCRRNRCVTFLRQLRAALK